MARNEVIRGGLPATRLRILFTVNHSAGDFVHEKGFYGWVQDDIDTSKTAWGVLFLEGVYELARTPNGVAMGVKLHAPATAQATTLPLIAAATNGSATAGWNAVGRTTATGNASAARVRLFGDNSY